MTTKRPGDVLAGRYRLDDLMSETRQGRFWRGHDRVLSRPVAIHVLDADDDRAPLLVEAARASARIVEPRLLRVLDIERDGELCYVVNEWGTGTSLDHLVGRDGPLPPRRAAWIVCEVAAALENAHREGVAHGRLNPENVLVDTTGSIRLIGFAVEAALHGLPADRIGTDVVDLVSLLHFALTGTWPGLTESGVPAARREHHGLEDRVLRPRQVRAGVPRPLDDLVDEVLNRPHGRHAGPNTAHEVHEALAAFVGDPNGLADELADRSRTAVVGRGVPVATTTGTTEARPADTTARKAGTADAAEPAPTVAGLPVFAVGPDDPDDPHHPDDADDGSGPAESAAADDGRRAPAGAREDGSLADGSWFAPRPEPPAPPPPLDPPPERPLFAPAPADGRPVRRPRVAVPAGAPTVAGVETSSSGSDPADSATYWPFDATPTAEPVPGRRWFRLAVVLALLVVLVVGAVLAYHATREDRATPRSAGPSSAAASLSTTAAPAPGRITGVTATDFDPAGSPPEENPRTVGRLVDGDPSTRWSTATYKQDLGPRGLKQGVGVVLDLRAPHRVVEVDLAFARGGTAVSLYVTSTAPRTAADLTAPVASLRAPTSARVRLVAPATGRFLALWFTSLPKVAGGYRTEVAEVGVVGTPA